MHTATSLLVDSMRTAAEIATAGEQVRSIGAVGSRLFTDARLEALYEMAYLRVFIAWEAFLEETFVLCLCGRLILPKGVKLVYPVFTSSDEAEAAILGNYPFFPWADPAKVCALSKRFVVSTNPSRVVGGPHHYVLSSNISRINAFKAIRNFVAHKSTKAKEEFHKSALQLSGTAYIGRTPGNFLREVSSTGVIKSRLEAYIAELGGIAEQIAP